MKQLPEDATDQQLREAIEEWVDLLAEGRLTEAVNWLYPSQSEPLTAERLDELLQGNWWDKPGADGRYAVTRRVDAEGDGPRFNLVRLTADPSAGNIHYDLPMNGRWSSYTAIFDFLVVNGWTVIALDDLHVL